MLNLASRYLVQNSNYDPYYEDILFIICSSKMAAKFHVIQYEGTLYKVCKYVWICSFLFYLKMAAWQPIISKRTIGVLFLIIDNKQLLFSSKWKQITFLDRI